MVVDIKPTECDDLFDIPGPSGTDLGSPHNGTIIPPEVARNARNMLFTHGFLQTFVVGIYAHRVRIARFDHMSGVVSQAFDLQEHPDLLQRFFWHFTHPLVGDTVVGCDPTVRSLTPYDLRWIRKELFEAGVHNVPAEIAEIKQGRRVKVWNERDEKADWYLLLRLLDVNARLLSRVTAVWLALQDSREYRGDEPVPPSTLSSGSQDERKGGETESGEKKHAAKKARPKVRVLKEVWRSVGRTPESAFYERLEACIPDDVRWGLPKWVCGTDLGAHEVHLREHKEPPATDHHYLDNDDNDDFRHRLPPETLAPPSPVSSRPLILRHMRFVVDNVGRPITEFKDTKELVLVMRDAIVGAYHLLESLTVQLRPSCEPVHTARWMQATDKPGKWQASSTGTSVSETSSSSVGPNRTLSRGSFTTSTAAR